MNNNANIGYKKSLTEFKGFTKDETGCFVINKQEEAEKNIYIRSASFRQTEDGYFEEDGNIEEVQSQLRTDDINRKDDKGCTALTRAAEDGNIDIVKLLLNSNADIGAKDNEGRVALIYAVYNGHIEIVKLLLGYGADMHHKNNENYTLCDVAADYNKLDIMKFLIEKGIKINNRIFSHSKNIKDIEFIKYIIEQIEELDIDNPDLLRVALKGQELFEYILDLGMKIHITEVGEKVAKQEISNSLENFNFDQAEMISKLSGITLNHKDMISNIANTLTNDLAKSQELYKYHAVIHLFEKAGITIPESIAKYVNDPKNYNSDDFPCIEGYIPSLVKKYALIAKENMIEKFGAGNVETNNIIDNLFNPPASYSEEFNKLNQLIKNPISTIDTEFEAYHYIVNEIMSKISNDYHLEMLAISGVQPQIIPETVTVFRGIKADLSDSQIESIFTYGHKAYNDAEYNALGYHSKHEWKSFSHASWEYGGTYVSLEAAHSIGFAGGNGILLEMDLPKGSPMICGRNTNECELIPNLKESGDIKAIYKLDGNLIVANLYVNPYYTPKDDKEFSLSFKEDDNAHNVAISKKEEYIKAYNNLECKIHEKNFKDYDHFIETHTSDKVQAIRDENYKNFGTISNDNTEGECTLSGVFDYYQMCEIVA